MHSPEWLQEFVSHYVATNGNASRAAAMMASAELGGPGLYYRGKFSQWANGSRLLRAARRHPSFIVWYRDAEKAKARVERLQGLSTNPLELQRLDAEAARAFAEHAIQGEASPPAPQPRFDPKWPSWFDCDDKLREFRGVEINTHPPRSLARSYIPRWRNERPPKPGEIQSKVGVWRKHTIRLEEPIWSRK